MKNLGIIPIYLIITFNIGDTINTPYSTLKNIYEIEYETKIEKELPIRDNSSPPVYIGAHLATPYPGTLFFEKAEEWGIFISKNWNDFYEGIINFLPNEFINGTSQQIKKWIKIDLHNIF